MFAGIVERGIKPIAYLPVCIIGYRDTAGFRDAFKTCRDVDPITEDVIIFEDNVSNVHAYAKLDTPVTLDGGITLCHPALNVKRATDRIHSARKFKQNAIASGLDDPPAVMRDGWVEKLSPMSLERGECAFLVDAH